jgi:glutamyl-tRNA reductase
MSRTHDVTISAFDLDRLERELAAVTEQRDRLAEAALAVVDLGLQKTIQTLREYNLWRRADEDMEQPDPREIGQAIDAAIEAMEQMQDTVGKWNGGHL